MAGCPAINLTARRFGRWRVMRRSGSRRSYATWLCECDCGKQGIVPSVALLRGRSRSCGCLHDETHRTHGKSGSPEWRAWVAAKRRVNDRKGRWSHYYAARGITMCHEWSNDFAAFYRDVGPKPSPTHSLDRINNDGNYEPGNCRWATQSEQCRNARRPVYRGPRYFGRNAHLNISPPSDAPSA